MLVATPSRMKMDGSWVIVQTPTFYENKIIESSMKDANITNIHPPPSMGEKINPTISAAGRSLKTSLNTERGRVLDFPGSPSLWTYPLT